MKRIVANQAHTFLHAHPSHVNAFWFPNLQKSGLRPCSGFLVKASVGFEGDEVPAAIRAIENLKSLGFMVIPGVGHFLSESQGHYDSTAWYDPLTYDRVIERLEKLQAYRDPEYPKLMFLDAEPYWEGDRYPETTNENERKIFSGCKKLRDWCKQKQVELLVMPGADPSYAHINGFKPFGKIQADEGSYDSNSVAYIRQRCSTMRSRRLGYWPGYFCDKLLHTSFRDKVGIYPAWFWMDPHVFEYWLFGTQEWMDKFGP